jgi:hypothetical protein
LEAASAPTNEFGDVMKKKDVGEVVKLEPGEVVQIGKGIYMRCAICNTMIKVNKFLFGSTHACSKGW